MDNQEYLVSERTPRSRRNGGAGGGAGGPEKKPGSPSLNNNLPGILVTALFVLIEGWFFFRLLRAKFVNGTIWMWLILAALVLLAALVGFLCWNFRKRIRFIIGALVALVFSAGLMFATIKFIDPARDTVEKMIETNPAQQMVTMSVYVRKEDPASHVGDLNGAVVGIMEQTDRDESEQVLDEISKSLTEPLSIIAYMNPAELIRGLYRGDVRAVIFDGTWIGLLSNQEEFKDIHDRIRLVTDYQAERLTPPATLSPESAVSTAADPEVPETTQESHGRRNWKVIRVETTEATQTQPSSEEGETYAPTTEYPEGPIETAPPPTQQTAAPWIGVPAGQESRIFTIYISGVDSREGGLPDRGNSDVNILAVINMNTKQALLISTPRDYYLSFPMAGGAMDKLTHAGWYNGANGSISVLQNLYGVNCPYYFRVGFGGVEKLVDTLKGITVHSDYEFTVGSHTFKVGPNKVNGKQALMFVRHRYGMPGGDRARGNNQMALIKGVIQKMASTSTLMNLEAVLGAVSEMIRTSVPYDTIAAFSQSMVNGETWNITQYSVNGTNGLAYCNSIGTTAFVIYPDYSTVSYAQSLIRRVYNGEVLPP
ncbi:MAG: LCP family protein [Lachnospiraceae bacterium]|nr:LCP family protein [Lachnospiraceae bacterium]